jgi:hypothetical protein
VQWFWKGSRKVLERSLACSQEDPLLQEHRREDPGELLNVQALHQGLERELRIRQAVPGGGMGGQQAVLHGKEDLGLTRHRQGDADEVGYG